MPDGITDALLIYNPASGRKRHRRFVEVELAARTLKDAGIRTELAPTQGPNAATDIARQAVEQRRGMVIVCGGDGTVNEVVNGLAGSDVPMALLPAGTANILAKELRIPWDIPQAARLIPGAKIRRVALGQVAPLNGNGSASPAIPKGGRYFLCVGGAGPDGAIVNGVNSDLKKKTRATGLLGGRISPAFHVQLSRNAGPIGRTGFAGDDSSRGPHGELRRPVQDHDGREPLRRFV